MERAVDQTRADKSGKPDAGAPSQGAASHLELVTTDNSSDMRMGGRLRKAREASDKSASELSKKLCIKREYIEAIESMQVKLIPHGNEYIIGYIRAYAKAVGLNEAETVARYRDECGALAPPKPVATPGETGKTNSGGVGKTILLAACAVLVAAGAASFFFLKPGSEPARTAPDAVALTDVVVDGSRAPLVATIPATAPALRNLDLEIYAVRRARLEVRGADGTKYIDRVLPAGESFLPRLDAGWTVTTDDGGAFEWRHDGQSIAAMGAAGVPLYAMRIDDVAARLSDQIAPQTAATETGVTPQ